MTDKRDIPTPEGVAMRTLERLLTVAKAIPAADYSYRLREYFEVAGHTGIRESVARFNHHRRAHPDCKAVACLAGWGAADKELNPNNEAADTWADEFNEKVDVRWHDLFAIRGPGDWDGEHGTSVLTDKQLAIYRIYRAIGYLQHQALPMTIEATKGA